MRSAVVAAALVALSCSVCAAQSEPPAYLDDRTDASSLVKSFYNAISRKEYARAWDYFGGRKPSVNFEAFVEGYEDTDTVSVVTGVAGVEGAAGSTFYALPVAFAALNKDGSEQVFAGCYTARLVNPQIQEPPFRSLMIESASLKPSEQPYEEKLPEKCGNGPAPQPGQAQMEHAKKVFAASFYPECSTIAADGRVADPETHAISFHYKSDAESEPERQAELFRFYCGSGAYNESHIYYLFDKIGGLRQVQFATPELDIRYENNDSEGAVEGISIVGYTADSELVNSAYDDNTKTITSAAKWRGVGDASSSGTWVFRNGAFSLIKYEVDASYDDEVNPETIVDFDTAP